MSSSENHRQDSECFQKRIVHANLVVINKLGVLITGKSNIGKSELTLALLDRGHQLVSDDVVDIIRQDNKLIGSCPAITDGYIVINGIGIIDVLKLFGLGAVVTRHEIHLSIALVHQENKPPEDLLNPTYQNEIVLGMTLPRIIFPVYAGKNLSLLVEILLRMHQLKNEGHDPNTNFNIRFQKLKNQYDSKKN